MKLSNSEAISLAWIITFSTVICVVKSDYVVMVRTDNFRNPGSLLANGTCCDFNEDGSCAVPGCDIYFSYCLRRNGVDGPCRSSSEINFDDKPLTFVKPTILGLPNPVPLLGPTKEWNVNAGVGFHLVVYEDDDQTNGGVVGQVFHDISGSLPVGQESGPFLYRYPDPKRAMVTLSFTVVCAENYYGPDCSQYCVCRNGQCSNGFTGACGCDHDFECEDNINECRDLKVNCSGNGQCIDDINSYSCICSAGYSGSHCEINVDDCLSNPCGAKHQCLDGVDSFSCICNAGYTGTRCDVDIDECQSNPCSVNGQCVDGIGSFTCNCSTGYTGTPCDIDINECLSNPCGINGQCENQEGSFSCSCDPGFSGQRCLTNIDDCVGVNCSGNGECLDGVNSFTCQCSPGHGGPSCAEEIRGSDIQIGPIVGGVLGALVSLILVLIIVVVVILTMRQCQGRKICSDALPGDNPVYDRGNTAIALRGITQTSAPVHYVNLASNGGNSMAESAPERILDNPIYGRNDEETEDMYVDPDTNHQAGTGMGSSPYHEFDNPIYGGEAEESTYSMLADSSTVSSTATATRQTMFESSKRGGALVIGNEQVYNHVN